MVSNHSYSPFNGYCRGGWCFRGKKKVADELAGSILFSAQLETCGMPMKGSVHSSVAIGRAYDVITI